MKVNGKEDDWLVVGIFKFVNQQGTIAYSTYEYISTLTHITNQAFSYRIVTDRHDPAYQQMMAERMDKYFRAQGFHVNQARTGKSTLKTASDSLDILVTFLLIMALLTALVGSIGLTGTMGMNVLERTREIGVMRSIGAVDREIMRTVIVEGMVIGGHLLAAWRAAFVPVHLFVIIHYQLGDLSLSNCRPLHLHRIPDLAVGCAGTVGGGKHPAGAQCRPALPSAKCWLTSMPSEILC